MKSLLAGGNEHVLAQVARSGALLAFDFDGTLAPIVSDREEAAMRPRTSSLFAQVCETYACAVISGRSRSDVAQRVGSARVKYLIGNHGVEAEETALPFRDELQDVRARLESAFSSLAGIDVEDKGYSLTVHYRQATAKRAARTAIRAAIATLPFQLRTIPGKLVVNLVPLQAPHKGNALQKLMGDAGAVAALYVGDDVTDEDVFLLAANAGVLGVRIGVSKLSAAPYYLRDQREIDALLTRLLSHKLSAD